MWGFFKTALMIAPQYNLYHRSVIPLYNWNSAEHSETLLRELQVFKIANTGDTVLLLWNNTGTQWWFCTSAFFEVALCFVKIVLSSFAVLPSMRNVKALCKFIFHLKPYLLYGMIVLICFLSEVMEGTFWFLHIHIENSYIKFTIKGQLAGTELQEVLLT